MASSISPSGQRAPGRGEMTEKQKRLLGLGDDNIVKEALTKLAKMEEISGITMPLGDYGAFWEAVRKDSTKAYDFLNQLILTLIEVEKKAAKNKDRDTKFKAKTFDDCYRMALAIVHTIHFVAFHLKIEVKTLPISMKMWENHRKETMAPGKNAIFSFDTNYVVQLTKKLHIGKENHIKSRVEECISDYAKWFASFASVMGGIDDAVTTGEIDCEEDFPFVYFQLKKILLGKEGVLGTTSDQRSEVFDNILEWLDKEKPKTKEKYMKANPEMTQKALLSLFYMMREFISIHPIADEAYLLKVISKVQLFYTWPKPYSDFCEKLLDLLHTEIKCPGNAMRKRFFEEHPLLTNIEQILESSDKIDKSLLHCDLINYSRIQRDVHVFIGAGDSCPESKIYSEMFLTPLTSDETFEAELLDLQKKLLLSIIETDLTLNPEGSAEVDENILSLNTVDPYSIPKWFRQGCQVLSNANGIKMDFYKGYRESFLADIVEEIAPSKGAVPVRYSSALPRDESMDSFASNYSETPDAPVPTDSICVKGAFSRRHVYDLPDLTFSFKVISQEPSAVGNGYADVLSEKNRINYSEEMDELRVKVKQLMKVANMFQDVLESNDDDTKIDRPILKMCCIGDDCTFHRILCSYVALINHKDFIDKSLKDIIDTRIYNIPTGVTSRNRIAEYIARRDPWYRRQVYSPFKELQFIPQLSVSESDERVDKCESSPLFHLRKLMEEYYRGAKNSLNVNVYDCECWLPNSDSINVTIPFCYKMEIGINCDVRQFQISSKSIVRRDGDGDSSSEMTWDSVLQDKYFNRQTKNGASMTGTTSELKVKYSVTDILKGNTKQIELPSSFYGFISVSNFPDLSNNDGGRSIASPTMPHVELSYLQNIRKYQEVIRKRDKTQKDIDALREIMMFDAVSEDITEMEVSVTDDDSQFDLLLDGKIFGSFTKIRITPTIIKATKEHLSLPIMSYFPID